MEASSDGGQDPEGAVASWVDRWIFTIDSPLATGLHILERQDSAS